MSAGFPRTTVGELSVSRLIMGTHNIHRQPNVSGRLRQYEQPTGRPARNTETVGP